MDEAELIRRYFAARAGSRPDVLAGIGDDGAVTRPPPGAELVTVTDILVEGTHFPTGTPAASMGHRCLAVNLSDLAAMGARPLWCTLALSLPKAEARWLEDFSAGFFALADRCGIVLIGGDTVRGPLAANVTAVGQVAPGQAILRRGARPGDSVYVSGTPGDAVAGRLLLAEPEDRRPAAEALRRRFLYPEPRLALGLALIGRATAMIDVSDGLHADLSRLAAASGVGLVLDAGQLPLSPELRAVAPDRAIGHALTGGDDYELAFTLPASGKGLLAELAGTVGVTPIGTVAEGSGVNWTLDGQPLPVPDTTYRHF